MLFGIILSIDATHIIDADRFPLDQHWEQTEEWESEEHEDWQHEKWSALLDEDQFKEFLDFSSLHLDGEGTALGMPMPNASNYGITPAYCYTYSDESVDLLAYVTPYPMPGEEIAGVNTFKRLPLFGNQPFDKNDWKKIGRHLQRISY